MSGKGMGCATQGGGAVENGAKNRIISKPSTKITPVMMNKGGMASKSSKGSPKQGKKGGAY